MKEIKDCKNVDDLFDVLALTPYWKSLDIRVLEGMAVASGQEDAGTTIELYRSVVYPQRYFESTSRFSADENNPGYANDHFYTKVKEEYNIDPKSVTVGDLVEHRNYVEKKKICLEMLAFLSIDPGCLVIYWLIPKVTAYYAYVSIKKSCYLSDSIVSFEIDEYPLIQCATESAMALEERLHQELHTCKRNTLSIYNNQHIYAQYSTGIFNVQ